MTDDSDPTDADIELILSGAGANAWSALWAAVTKIEAVDERTTWSGGQQIDTTLVDGVERPVIQMPYAIYSEGTDRAIEALYELGAIVPFDWPAWDGIRGYRGPDALDTAPVADAVRMLTAIVRADRFSEGTIGATLEDGTFLAALRRLRRWHNEEGGNDV